MQLGPWVLPSIQHDAVSVYNYIGPDFFITFNCRVFLQVGHETLIFIFIFYFRISVLIFKIQIKIIF